MRFLINDSREMALGSGGTRGPLRQVGLKLEIGACRMRFCIPQRRKATTFRRLCREWGGKMAYMGLVIIVWRLCKVGQRELGPD